ncbi:MAG: substrate-binding domain-containing protein [Clostridia bacterium]|nr:substrate-binding domain-containing protein [Clostridia bacterium]
MKKLVTLLLTLVLCMACFAGCKINKDGEISVLWSDKSDSLVVELADSMDRSMYLYNMEYKHYDAENSSTKQLDQLEDVLEAGCQGVIIELVDIATAQTVIDTVKPYNVPVVIINQEVDTTIIESYEKAFNVRPYYTYEQEYTVMLENYLKDNFKLIDRNGDNKLTVYNEYGSYPTDFLSAPERSPKYEFETVYDIAYDGSVELILTADDARAVEVLVELRKQGFNKDKLQTHLVGLFTVGIDQNAGVIIDDGKVREGDALKDYQNKLAAYSVMNVIDDGLIQGAIVLNDDGITEMACEIIANVIKGKPAIKEGLDEEYFNENGTRNVDVKYVLYGV